MYPLTGQFWFFPKSSCQPRWLATWTPMLGIRAQLEVAPLKAVAAHMPCLKIERYLIKRSEGRCCSGWGEYCQTTNSTLSRMRPYSKRLRTSMGADRSISSHNSILLPERERVHSVVKIYLLAQLNK